MMPRNGLTVYILSVVSKRTIVQRGMAEVVPDEDVVKERIFTERINLSY